MTYKDIPYEEVEFCIFQALDRLEGATRVNSTAKMAYEMGNLAYYLKQWLNEHRVQEESE